MRIRLRSLCFLLDAAPRKPIITITSGSYKRRLALVVAFLAMVSLHAETSVSALLRSSIDPTFALSTSMPGTIVVNVAGTNQNIGDLTFSSNIPGTWRISISSENGGALVRDGGAERFPYRFNFGADVRNHDLNSNLVLDYYGPRAPRAVSLSLDFSPAFSLGIPTGTYRDTITITLSAL